MALKRLPRLRHGLIILDEYISTHYECKSYASTLRKKVKKKKKIAKTLLGIIDKW